ncbi:hypothetical protein [Bdellovibrio reynosensis]|uniref:Uncharacterized protein n=1 Tax=Bdellovibrio reynosensis TaxID=2835041 RepID=A0ABY4CA58_9BACT|nr:hypothetical protein [Bdellovibrio reynosensis]UOF01364.1 hypothetical protein MNR06_00150 [Bdellovibrio reynosensis]
MNQLLAITVMIAGILSISPSQASHASVPEKTVETAQDYRNLTLKVRTAAEFMVPFPGMKSSITYSFEFAEPAYQLPIISDIHMASSPVYFYRNFWDRIFFKDGSYMEINGERLPLTCMFISGQDNRYGQKDSSPLFPEFVIRVYLVANDYSCQGPKKPGWPEVGGKEENWDTYIHYEIKDPTIMLPVDAKIRYRWNEFNMVLVDRGA